MYNHQNRFAKRKRTIRERITDKLPAVVGGGLGVGFVIMMILGVLGSIALPIVIIWAIIKMVMHFT